MKIVARIAANFLTISRENSYCAVSALRFFSKARKNILLTLISRNMPFCVGNFRVFFLPQNFPSFYWKYKKYRQVFFRCFTLHADTIITERSEEKASEEKKIRREKNTKRKLHILTMKGRDGIFEGWLGKFKETKLRCRIQSCEKG